MIAATVIAALSWPSLHMPNVRTPAFVRKAPETVERILPHRHAWSLDDPHGEPIAIVPTRMRGGLLLAEVRIDKKAYWFVVDSAAPRTLLDLNTVRKAKLRLRGPQTPDGQRLLSANLRLDGAVIFTPDPRAVDLSRTPLRGRADGVLGAELFTAYVVRIDPQRNRMAIYSPVTYRPDASAFVPVTRKGGGFFTPVRIETRYGASSVVDAKIDTGAEEFASAGSAAAGAESVPALIRDGLAWRWTRAARVRTVEAGGQSIYNAWVITDPEARLGMDFFRRFETTLDVSHGKMWLTPTAVTWTPTPEPRTAP
ncbi:MAG: hypothetical protein ACXW3D_10175 [Caulobacteraceae bacterium]